MSSPNLSKSPARFGSRRVLALPLLLAIGLTLAMAGCGLNSSDVAVIGHSCTPNGDGSVHVQGKLKNEGTHSEAAIIEYKLTLYGGETETSKPFGGYSVPSGESSLVGEDLNVPSGAEWVDCSVEVVG